MVNELFVCFVNVANSDAGVGVKVPVLFGSKVPTHAGRVSVVLSLM
jgi:hypothetical protein